MEEMLKLLISEVEKIKNAVNNIDERLNRMEIANSKNIKTESFNRQDSDHEKAIIHKNQCLEDSNTEKRQLINLELLDIWNKALEIIKRELTEVSFNTWIKIIKPIKMNKEVIYFTVPSNFTQEIARQRYSRLIQTAIYGITGVEYQLRFYVEGKNVSQNNEKLHTPESSLENHSLLNAEYNFNTLVVGEYNQLAYKSALEAAQNRCGYLNLLYIYGGAGLGKTHILQAVGNYILDNRLSAKVKYMTMDDFTNAMIAAIRDDSLPEFRNRLLRNDVFIFDNFQYIAGKERTQEEFHKIVTAMLEEGKQVIIGCTKPPEDILVLSERFTSLFTVNGVFQISKLDLDTKIEMLKRKAVENNIKLNDEIISIMIDRNSMNVRELLGGFNRLVSYSKLTGKQISIEMVREFF